MQQPGLPGIAVASPGPGQNVNREGQGVRIAQNAENLQALPQQGHGVARQCCRIQQLQGPDAHGRAFQMPVGSLQKAPQQGVGFIAGNGRPAVAQKNVQHVQHQGILERHGLVAPRQQTPGPDIQQGVRPARVALHEKQQGMRPGDVGMHDGVFRIERRSLQTAQHGAHALPVALAQEQKAGIAPEHGRRELVSGQHGLALKVLHAAEREMELMQIARAEQGADPQGVVKAAVAPGHVFGAAIETGDDFFEIPAQIGQLPLEQGQKAVLFRPQESLDRIQGRFQPVGQTAGVIAHKNVQIKAGKQQHGHEALIAAVAGHVIGARRQAQDFAQQGERTQREALQGEEQVQKVAVQSRRVGGAARAPAHQKSHQHFQQGHQLHVRMAACPAAAQDVRAPARSGPLVEQAQKGSGPMFRRPEAREEPCPDKSPGCGARPPAWRAAGHALRHAQALQCGQILFSGRIAGPRGLAREPTELIGAQGTGGKIQGQNMGRLAGRQHGGTPSGAHPRLHGFVYKIIFIQNQRQVLNKFS